MSISTSIVQQGAHAKRVAIEQAKRLFNPSAPESMKRRFITNTPERLAVVRSALLHHYFADRSDAFVESEEGRRHLHDTLVRRLEKNRQLVIPWLTSLRSLEGARVLEIGCGTGSSSVALAEQGAHVTGVDIDSASLAVAQARACAYEVDIRLICANATDMQRLFGHETFDLIIFYATLEHMTVAERLSAIRSTWEMLPTGGLWCVTEAPNRLWFFDAHTSFLPFFHWLPDDLAMRYGTHSMRSIAEEGDDPSDPTTVLHFLRHGRGVSYHEFELALGAAVGLPVVSSMPAFLRRANLLRWALWRVSGERRYERFLARVGPDIHPGFYHEWLHLVLQKGGQRPFGS